MTRQMHFFPVVLLISFAASSSFGQSGAAMGAPSATKFYAGLEGHWKGSYSLWLRPGAPEEKSAATAVIQPAAKGNYFLMTYSWKKGKDSHEGVFLFGGKGVKAIATWGDSFHSVPETMFCMGELTDGGKKLVLHGTYAAGSGPDWGWRTELTRQSDTSLLMEAYNITPEGEEVLAVRAELTRGME